MCAVSDIIDISKSERRNYGTEIRSIQSHRAFL